MPANYCSDCGSELSANAEFCPECGSEVGNPSTGQQPSASHSETVERTDSQASNTMFKATSGLIAGYFVFFIFGFSVSSNALIGLGAISLLASLVTMYVDLRDLDSRLWNTRPILWVVGAALLYIVVAPLYVYKRRQVS